MVGFLSGIRIKSSEYNAQKDKVSIMKIELRLIPNNNQKIFQAVTDPFLDRLTLGSVMADPAPEGIGNSLLTTIGRKVAKGAVKAVGAFGDEKTNAILLKIRPMMTNRINAYLFSNDIPAAVTVNHIEIGENSMKIILDVDSIDYKGVIIKVLPLVADSVQKNEALHIVTQIFDIFGDEKAEVIGAVLDAVDDGKKEALVKLLANHYSEKISRALTDYLCGRNMEVSVSQIHVD